MEKPTAQEIKKRISRASRLYIISALLYIFAAALFFGMIIGKARLDLILFSLVISFWCVVFSIFFHVITARRINKMQKELDELVSPDIIQDTKINLQ
ncbi:hypothetical protein M1506_02295 [Patescibacteria group bacterium]|nr:hypothetical protein [Patescibacteria group bacterium]